MKFFKWEDKYLVGIPELDKQHQHLVKIINDLYDGMVANQEEEAINKTLASLVDYTIYHFKNEENIFKKYNYANYTQHKNQHDRLTEKVQEIQKKLKDTDEQLSLDILEFLREWLISHTLSSDQEYAGYFRDRNIDVMQ